MGAHGHPPIHAPLLCAGISWAKVGRSPSPLQQVGALAGSLALILRVRGEKPQGPTDELHQQALYSSPGPEHWALRRSSGTWLRMDATSRDWAVAAPLATPE